MSLPVLSAAAHVASRAPEGADLALPKLWTDGWGNLMELGAGLGTLGLGVLICPLPLTRCATLGKSLNLSGPCFLICTSEDNDY